MIREVAFHPCLAQKLLDKDSLSAVTASSFISFSFLVFICSFTPVLADWGVYLISDWELFWAYLPIWNYSCGICAGFSLSSCIHTVLIWAQRNPSWMETAGLCVFVYSKCVLNSTTRSHRTTHCCIYCITFSYSESHLLFCLFFYFWSFFKCVSH